MNLPGSFPSTRYSSYHKTGPDAASPATNTFSANCGVQALKNPIANIKLASMILFSRLDAL